MKRAKANPPLLIVSLLITITIFPLAVILWLKFGERAFATSMFLLGLSLGPCLTLYALVAPKRKQLARGWVLLTGGLSILAFAVLGAVNLDLEGFFMLLFLGAGGLQSGTP